MFDNTPEGTGMFAGCFFIVWLVAFVAGLALLGTVIWGIVTLVQHYT